MYGVNSVTSCFIANAFTEVLDTFGIHWQLLLIQSLNFLLVVAILYFVAFKPILRTIDERREKIESGLKYADEMKRKLGQAEVSAEERLTRAKNEARQIIEDANSQAKEYVEQQRLEMEQMTQEMLTAAQRNIADEKAKMMDDLKEEVKTLVADVAAKVLAKSMTNEERQQYQSMAEIEL